MASICDNSLLDIGLAASQLELRTPPQDVASVPKTVATGRNGIQGHLANAGGNCEYRQFDQGWLFQGK